MHSPPRPTDAATLLAETRWLRALARRMLALDADAVAQDAWLAARPERGDQRPAWLAGIVRHLVLRQHRAERARRHHEASAARPEAGAPPAADEVERTQNQRRLLDAVLALPEPYRTTVILRFLDGLGTRAIARRQGVTPAAVRQRITRALATLRAKLIADAGDRFGARRALRALCLPAPRPLALGAATAPILMSTKLAFPLLAIVLACLGWLGYASLRGAPAAPNAASEPDAGSLDSAPAPIVPKRTDHTGTVPPVARTPALAGALAAADRELDLQGVVVDQDGRRIAGARLRVCRDPTSGYAIPDLEYGAIRTEVAQAVSDAAGEFAIRLRPGVAVELHARAPDFAPTLLTNRYAGERVTVKLTKGARIEGRVLQASGSAVVAASVRVVCFDGVSATDLCAVTTDTDGTFEAGPLAAGTVRLEVEPRDAPPPPWQTLRLEPGATTRVTCTVGDGVTLRGHVVDAATGTPIAGAEVGLGWTFRRRTETDAQGQYQMRGFAREGYDICVRAEGFGRARKMLGAAEGGAVVVDFALRPGRRVVGRVVDPEGAPCPEVYVAAAATVLTNGLGDTDWRAARTAVDGRFELTDLAPERGHTLFLKRDGFATVAYALPARARQESPFDAGTLQLQPAATLRGVLVGTDGLPVPDGLVELSGVNADFGRLAEDGATRARELLDRSVRTDDLGRFTFADLAAGSYTVRPRRRGEPAQAGVPVALAAGEERRDLRLTLIVTLGIDGKVVDETGAGVPEVFVLADGESSAVTDADGTFHLRGLTAGAHSLQAMLTGSTSGESALLPVPPTTVEAGSTGVRLVMRRAATIRGVVLDAGGLPVPNARVWAEDGAGAFVASTLAAADGTFALALSSGAIVDLLARPGHEDETLFIHAREKAEDAGRRAHERAVQAPADGLMLRLPASGK